MGNSCRRSALREKLSSLLVAALLMTGMVLGQSQSQSTPPSQTSPQAQPLPQQNQGSLGDTARKAKTDKGKSKAHKVYTDEDLPTGGHSVSVVGQATPTEDSSLQAKNSDRKSESNEAAKQEEYWRGRARKIREQMDAVDQEIARLKEDIKKNGSSGFDAASGLQKNVIYIVDKNAQLQRLEKKKADLEKEMDQLGEKGRKAGASPSWFR